jgi:hypothetical protein
MYACPHCNQPGISWTRRAMLGPAVPATCDKCGGKIGVPWVQSFAAVAPFLIGVLFAQNTPNPILGYVAVGIGAIAMLILHFTWVPLVKK